MRAMVLAAGFGTRLHPLTATVPKPLLPIANRPMIEYTFDLLARGGVREVMVNTHHLAELMEDRLGEVGKAGLTVHLSRERKILGTAGGPKKAAPFLDGGTFVLCNGDFLADIDLQEVLAFHRSRGAAATMVLRDDPAGEIFIDNEGRIRRFLEGEGPWEDLRRTGFTGIHLLEPQFFGLIPKNTPWEINLQAYPAMKKKGWPLFGYLHHDYWREAGNPADYLRANMEVLSGRAGAIAIAAGAGTLNPSSNRLFAPVLVGESASIEDGAAVGPGVVLGPQSLVESGATVKNTVVCEGALVPGDGTFEDVIISPEGILTAGSLSKDAGR